MAKVDDKIEDKKFKEEQESYIQTCQIRHDHRIKICDDKEKQISKEIEQTSKQLMLYVRALNDIQIELNDLKNNKEKSIEKYREEFKALKSMKNYKSIQVSFSNNRPALVGFTNMIYIQDKNQWYKIGKFKVVIQDGTINIDNLTSRKEGYNHPHVQGNGTPCLGDLQSSLPKLMGNHEYALVFDIIHKYLCSYNERSPYKKVEAWERVSKPGDDA